MRISQCEIIESFIDAFRDYPSSIALGAFQRDHRSGTAGPRSIGREFSLVLARVADGEADGQAGIAPGLFRALVGEAWRWLPALDRCAQCGRAVPRQRHALFLAARFGDFLREVPRRRACEHCRPRRSPREEDRRRTITIKIDDGNCRSRKYLRELTDCMLDIRRASDRSKVDVAGTA